MNRKNRETIKDFRERYPDAPRAHRMAFRRLLSIADRKNITVVILALVGCSGMIVGDCIGLDSNVESGQMLFSFAHELAHSVLHTGRNLIENPDQKAEVEADRVANLILMAMGFFDQEISAWA